MIVELIDKKRHGVRLSRAEIEELVLGYVRGEVPDYQVAAWLMAVCCRGMSGDELADLTMVMAESGRRLDLSSVGGIVVDKHSTGGVGDKTSLLVVPLVAACGVPVAKMSGRGLGFSGGTLDKLESLAGFQVDVSGERFVEQLRTVGAVIAGQSPDLAPADGQLYALRDVTATVASVPLIASSVMSKKLAGGAQAIVLDVKCGRGAFMQSEAEAVDLAEAMIEIGRAAGRTVTAFVTDMDQPLGRSVGNALEVREAALTLKRGEGDPRLTELVVELAAEMLILSGAAADPAAARARALEAVRDGSGHRKLAELVAAQGGDVAPLHDPDVLMRAAIREEVPAERSGFVADVDPLAIARAANRLGAGRARKGDAIDHAAGVEIILPVGARVVAGEPLAILHANDPARLAGARPLAGRAFAIADAPAEARPLIRARLSTTP
jgi:pyrimidine-nucleoside phosphorylase